MNYRTVYMSLLFLVTGCCLASPAQQNGRVEPGNTMFDPIKQLTSSFPDSTKLKNSGRLLEFCPDGTCDGFVVAGTMSVATLKDFAYLYEYFFSDYTFLDEWRAREEAKNTAQRVLSKPEYNNCKSNSSREAARCVLRDLSRNGRVKLIFVRYDEGERHVVRMDIDEQLAEKKPAPKEQ
jgi:hypothetical protein